MTILQLQILNRIHEQQGPTAFQDNFMPLVKKLLGLNTLPLKILRLVSSKS